MLRAGAMPALATVCGSDQCVNLGRLAHVTTLAALWRGGTWVTSCSQVVNLERKRNQDPLITQCQLPVGEAAGAV